MSSISLVFLKLWFGDVLGHYNAEMLQSIHLFRLVRKLHQIGSQRFSRSYILLRFSVNCIYPHPHSLCVVYACDLELLVVYERIY